jgi:LysR family pca operon transcriptional activator
LKRVAIDTSGTEGPVGFTVRRGGEAGEGARLLVEAIRGIVAAAARGGRANAGIGKPA